MRNDINFVFVVYINKKRIFDIVCWFFGMLCRENWIFLYFLLSIVLCLFDYVKGCSNGFEIW